MGKAGIANTSRLYKATGRVSIRPKIKTRLKINSTPPITEV